MATLYEIDAAIMNCVDAWEGEGGVLDFKELTEQQQGKNSFTAWSDAGKKQNTLINTSVRIRCV